MTISPVANLKFGEREIKQFYVDLLDETNTIMRLVVVGDNLIQKFHDRFEVKLYFQMFHHFFQFLNVL